MSAGGGDGNLARGVAAARFSPVRDNRQRLGYSASKSMHAVIFQ